MSQRSGKSSPISVWAALASVYLIWGSTYLGIKFMIATIPAFLSASLRFFIAGVALYAFRRLRGDARPTLNEWRATAIVGLFLLAGGNGCVVWAEQHVPSGLTALLIGTTPLWIVLLDWARPGGRRPGWRALAGVLIGFGGIVMLVGTGDPGGRVDPLGVAVLVLGTFLWASGSLYGRSAPLPESPLLGTSMEMLAGSAGLLLLGTISGEWTRLDIASISTKSLVAMGYLIVFGSWVAFSSYTWLLRHAPIPLVATYAYVNPVVAILLGNLLAQEPITPKVILAAAIILGAVVLTTTASQRGRRAPAVAEELLPDEASP